MNNLPPFLLSLFGLLLVTVTAATAEVPLSPEGQAAYKAHLAKATKLVEQEKVEEAVAEVKAARTLNAKGYEAPATLALILQAAGKPQEAAVAIAEALKLAPAEAKSRVEAIAKMVGPQAATPPAATATPAADKQPSNALTGAARRKYDTLLVIVGEADQAKSPVERKKLLEEFLAKSAEFVDEYPDILPVWVLRAGAALELEQENVALMAGSELLRLGAEDMEDPKLRQLIAKLDRKGWLRTPQQMAESKAAEERKHAAANEERVKWLAFVKGSGNSLGMRFVAVPGTSVYFSIWETRVQDFEAFVRETGHDATAGMYSSKSDKWKQRGDSWKAPGFSQGPTHPVCGVSWEDAQAFCKWLSQKEGKTYRLPTDAEWSAAVGLNEAAAGTPEDKNGKVADVFPWGTSFPPRDGAGNYAGSEARNSDWPSDYQTIENYRDAFARTAPVGSFEKNQFGLYDLGGNLSEWCEDKYSASTENRVLRGASWRDDARVNLSSSFRFWFFPGSRNDFRGFRVVLVVGETR